LTGKLFAAITDWLKSKLCFYFFNPLSVKPFLKCPFFACVNSHFPTRFLTTDYDYLFMQSLRYHFVEKFFSFENAEAFIDEFACASTIS